MLQAMSLLHQSCSLSPLSTCSKHLKSSTTTQTQTHYISIAQVLQLPAGPRFPDLWMAVFFHLHVRLIKKKTWPWTCLLPFYFHLNEYNVVSMLVAFSFVLLSLLLSNSCFLQMLYALVIWVVWMPFLEWTNIFLLYSEYFILFIFKLAI